MMKRDVVDGAHAAHAAQEDQRSAHNSSSRLLAIVEKHRTTTFQRPIAAHTQEAFDVLQRRCETTSPTIPLILDSCCGTAMSTVQLAAMNPHALVVGIDRSAARLTKARAIPDNALVVRADCVDFWRLCVAHNLTFEQHYLLYPNPYPKSEQLTRRWYAHPVLEHLLVLARTTELRTNCAWYVDDFAMVLQHRGISTTLCELRVDQPLTAFEKKYALAGQTLWQLRFDAS